MCKKQKIYLFLTMHLCRTRNKMLRISFMVIFLSIIIHSCNMNTNKRALQKSDILAALQGNMDTQQEWIKVHAAEFLLWSGYPQGVKVVFLKEEELYGGKSPYRIGIWRVLAQAETDREEKNKWIDKIKQAYLDDSGSDRLHAIETLAKLSVSPFKEGSQLSDILTTDSVDSFSVYKLWSFAYTTEQAFMISQDSLLRLSMSTSHPFAIRAISAYALKKLGKLDHASWKDLAQMVLGEQVDSPIRINLLNTAIITADEELEKTDQYSKMFDELSRYAQKKDAGNGLKISFFDVLAEKGKREHLELLQPFCNQIKNEQDRDMQSYALHAFLRIYER